MASERFLNEFMENSERVGICGSETPDVFIDRLLELSREWRTFRSSTCRVDWYMQVISRLFRQYSRQRIPYLRSITDYSSENESEESICHTEFSLAFLQIFESSAETTLPETQTLLRMFRDAERSRRTI